MTDAALKKRLDAVLVMLSANFLLLVLHHLSWANWVALALVVLVVLYLALLSR